MAAAASAAVTADRTGVLRAPAWRRGVSGERVSFRVLNIYLIYYLAVKYYMIIIANQSRLIPVTANRVEDWG